MRKNIKKRYKKDRNFVKILGIKVLSTTITSVLTRVKNFISHNNKFYIVTPNPELILMAQTNKELYKALNKSDLPIPDGVGLKAAIFGLSIIKGRDLFGQLINLARKKGWRVFFLGGLGNEAELVARKLQIQDSRFKIRALKGPRLDNDAMPASGADIKLQSEAIKRINDFKPHLLFVAFGNPKQEIWIHKNLPKLKIGGAMAVGGTFRYIAGLSKLPPKWMEKLGLEWLFRLITEPFRFIRVWNAVIVFPLKVWLNKQSLPLRGKLRQTSAHRSDGANYHQRR